jgi:GntR family transcriptional regulator
MPRTQNRARKSVTVKRDSHVTLYVQIADQLAQEMVTGKYQPFDRLPSEQELMARFQVSRVTVRQAIAQLLRQGLVVAKQGKGTFVKGPVMRHGLQDLKGFYDTLVFQGLEPETRLLEFAPAAPPPRVAGLMKAKAGERLVVLKRLYYLKSHPFALVAAYLPSAATRVTWEQACEHPIYSVLEEVLAIKIARADVSIRAQQAGKEVASMLDLQPRMPVLVMERVSYSAASEPCEHSVFTIRPETYEFHLSVRGPLQITSSIKKHDVEPALAKPVSMLDGT